MTNPAVDTGKFPPISTTSPHTSERTTVLAAKGGGITFAGKLFTYACRLVMTVILVRAVGQEQYGLYNLAISALTIAAVLSGFGLDAALVRYIAVFARRRDDAGVWGTLQIGLGVTAVLGVSFGVGLYTFAQPIAERLSFKDPELIPSLASLLRLVSVIVPFLALNIIIAAATQGFKKMQYAAVARDIVQPFIRVVLMTALLLVGLNVAGALVIYGIAVVITSIMLLRSLHRLFSLRRAWRTGRRETKELMRFSVPVFLTDLMTTFRENVQSLLLGALNSVASVGLYAVANQVNLIGHMFHTSIMTSARPIISELYDQGARQQMGRIYQTTTKWSLAANLPLFLILVLFPAQILSIFNREFADGSVALVLLACANMADVSTGMCGAMLDMTGHTKLKLLNAVLRFVLSIVLSLLLIPQWGVLGAAIAVVATVSIVNLLRLVQVFVLFRLLPYDWSSVKPLLAGAAALGVMLLLGGGGGDGSFVALVLRASVLLLVYVGVLLLLGLSQDDRAVLAAVRKRFKGGRERKR